MKIEFRTNARCQGCVAKIREAIAPFANPDDWTFDLDSPDRLMIYSGDAPLDTAAVENAVKAVGFKCECL